MVNPNWQPNWLGGAASGAGAAGLGAAGAAGAAAGGGWLSSLGTTLMGPAGLPIMMGGSLLQGIIGGLFEGARKKKIKKAFEKQQSAYQSKASQLFPELSQAAFQNPEVNRAIQAALGQRMGNMFPSWGMPTGMQAGAGTLQDVFNQLMVPAQQTKPPQRLGLPDHGPLPGAGGGRMV